MLVVRDAARVLDGVVQFDGDEHHLLATFDVVPGPKFGRFVEVCSLVRGREILAAAPCVLDLAFAALPDAALRGRIDACRDTLAGELTAFQGALKSRLPVTWRMMLGAAAGPPLRGR